MVERVAILVGTIAEPTDAVESASATELELASSDMSERVNRSQAQFYTQKVRQEC